METPGRLKRPRATWALAALLVLVYAADLALGGKLFFYGKRDAHYFFLAPEPHRYVTSLFLHGNLAHLVINTLSLLVLGAMIEEVVGAWMLVLTFLFSGITGNLVAADFGPNAVGVGASGGLAGIFGLLVICSLRRVYPATREQMLMMVVVFLLAAGMAFGPLPVDNWAHLGGFLAGMVLGLFARRGGMHPAGWPVAVAILALLWWRLTATPWTSPG